MGDSPASKLTTATARNLHHLSARELITELLDGADIAPGVLATDWPTTLADLVHRDVYELANMLGIQLDEARKLTAAFELHRRIVAFSVPDRANLSDPKEVLAVMAPHLTLHVEHFWCLPLNARCDLIGQPVETGVGDIDGVDVSPRAFFRAALRCGAVQAIAVHNHPTGDPSPSGADMAVTRRLQQAGRALDIKLLDHVIVTPDRSRWCSMRLDTPQCFVGIV